MDLNTHLAQGNTLKLIREEIMDLLITYSKKYVRTKSPAHRKHLNAAKAALEKALNGIDGAQNHLEEVMCFDIPGVGKDPYFTHIYYGDIGSYRKMKALSQKTPPNPLAESPQEGFSWVIKG